MIRIKNRYLIGVAAGLSMAISWPYIVFDSGIWISLVFGVVLLLTIIDRTKALGKKNAANFLPLYVAFLVWNVCTTYWLFMVEESMGVRIFSILSPSIVNALIMVLPWVGYGFLDRYLSKIQAFAGLIFLWLGYEYFHQNWELTWPWLLFGNVFSESTSLIQWYEFTGVQGGTLWIILLGITLYQVTTQSQKITDWTKEFNKKYFIPFLATLILPIVASFWIGQTTVWTGEEKNVLAVQPNLNPYSEKFHPNGFQAQLDNFIHQIKNHPGKIDLALLPETALQEPSRYGFNGNQIVLSGLWENQLEQSPSVQLLQNEIVTQKNIPLLSGMSSQKMVEAPFENLSIIRPVYQHNNFGRIAYNAALYLDKNTIASYHKSKLVPGVEITPYAWIFSHFKDVALDLGGTTGSLGTQKNRDVFTTSTGIKAAPVICYESVFGDYLTGYINNGANLIAVLTNDGWWQNTAGHQQHFSYSKLRAIETRRDVVRCANTGISSHINQLGQEVSRLEYEVEGNLLAKVRLNNQLTFFTKHGDFLGRNALFLAGLLLALGIVRKVKRNAVL